MTKEEVEEWIKIIGEEWEESGSLLMGYFSCKCLPYWYSTKEETIRQWLRHPFVSDT